jgi:hypothetical protein
VFVLLAVRFLKPTAAQAAGHYVVYARNWAGKVKWYIDNKGVIENF